MPCNQYSIIQCVDYVSISYDKSVSYLEFLNSQILKRCGHYSASQEADIGYKTKELNVEVINMGQKIVYIFCPIPINSYCL